MISKLFFFDCETLDLWLPMKIHELALNLGLLPLYYPPHPSFCFPFWSRPAHGSLTDQAEPCSLIPMGLSKCFCFCQGDHPFLYFLFLKRKKVSCSVMSDSLQHHGLYSPWNSLGQNTGVGRLSLFQGIFPTQGLFFFNLFWVPIKFSFILQTSSRPRPFGSFHWYPKASFWYPRLARYEWVIKALATIYYNFMFLMSFFSPRSWTDWRLISLVPRPW